jgi:hypothetical protein
MRTAFIGFITTSVIGLALMGVLIWNMHVQNTLSADRPHEFKTLASERADFHSGGFFKDSID